MYIEKSLKILSDIAGDTNTWTYRVALEALAEEDYKHLVNYIGLTERLVREVKKSLREVEIDRKTDYAILIQQCKKRFSDHDIGILEFLGASEYGYTIKGIAAAVGKDYKTTRLRLRRLSRLGLVVVFNGGWTEDGEIMGSGYSLQDRHRHEAERIVANYLAATKQQTLVLQDTAYD